MPRYVRTRQASIKQVAKRYSGIKKDPLGSLSRANKEYGARNEAEVVERERAARTVDGARLLCSC